MKQTLWLFAVGDDLGLVLFVFLSIFVNIAFWLWIFSFFRTKLTEESTHFYLQKTKPQKDLWRWRTPKSKKKFKSAKEGVESSSIPFVPESDFAAKMGAVMGYVCFLGGVVVLPLHFFLEGTKHQEGLDWSYKLLHFLCLCLLGGGVGWALLQVDRRVSLLELREDRLIVHVVYGLILKRQIEYQKGVFVGAIGRMQSFWETNRYQDVMFFRLKIRYKNVLGFTSHTTFMIKCHEEQGKWLAGGLNFWKYGEPLNTETGLSEK